MKEKLSKMTVFHVIKNNRYLNDQIAVSKVRLLSYSTLCCLGLLLVICLNTFRSVGNIVCRLNCNGLLRLSSIYGVGINIGLILCRIGDIHR